MRGKAEQGPLAVSVLEHVTKRVAVITPPRALVVLRFVLNKPKNTLCFRSKLTTCFHPNSYTRSAETGEIFGLDDLSAGQTGDKPPPDRFLTKWIAGPQFWKQGEVAITGEE